MPTEGQVILPSQFGRYTLMERLAVGGMAEVFRAKIVSSHGFEKIIVIKRILPHLAADRTFVTMFIDEAKLTAQLTHPKIVQVLDFGDVGGQYFIALEYIDGYDALALLRAAAQKRVRVPLSLVVFVIAEILDALDYAHTATDMEGRPMHLVHRDISPSNVFIARHGDVKLGDFGIAHAADRESKTQAGTLKGKYGYMSPEQVVGGALDGRSDLFAVGIVLAEAFMGRRLFTAKNDLDVLLMVRDGRIERLDRYGHDIPPELSRIVRKALLRDVSQRYQTAAEFRDDLADTLLAQGKRVGPADLRAFMADLVDGSPQAMARVQATGRRLSEPPLSKGGGAAATTAPVPVPQPVNGPVGVGGGGSGGVSHGKLQRRRSMTPTPAVIVTGASGPQRTGDTRLGLQSSASLPQPLGSTAAAAAPESSPPADSAANAVPVAQSQLADALSAPAFSLVDLDQWSGAADPHSSVRHTGWTPVSSAPVRPSPGTPRASAPGVGGAAPAFPDTRTDVGRFASAAPNRPPDSAGDLGVVSPMRVLADVTVAGETGLLRFERDDEIKEVFLVAGAPESVSSSVAGDRFGAYLVARGVLRPAELEMALGMLPHFSGKLGDTLVGLGLMQPLDVFRQLSQQVRDRVIDLFRWSRGAFAFYRGLKNDQESFPLGLDAFEILGAGVLTVPTDELEQRFSAWLDSRPRRSERRHIDPDAFRLGPTPREVLALLEGDRTLREWMAQFTVPDELVTFLRSLYLLVETDLAELD